MSGKLLWTGLTMVIALERLWPIAPWGLFGALVMVAGVILLWLDK